MIYCSRFANMGRLGNHIMRLMTIISFAKKYGVDFCIPPWSYAKYFDSNIPQANISQFRTIKEPYFHYTPEYWDKIDFKNKTIDLYGWFQSFKYWDKDEVLRVLRFKEEFLNDLKTRYKEVFMKPVLAVSVRRGDFVGNPNYYQLPAEYYKGAIEKHFSKEYNILLFSDDIEWCKKNFDNCFFAEGSDIEQLALMTLCTDYVISNSTFSFCGAYLSQNKNAKVIRPKYNFAGPLANRKSEADYWPPEWIIYDFEKTKAAVIVYHKNISSLYPAEWVERFKNSIRNQTYQGFDIFELNYGGTEERIFEESIFESFSLPTFVHAMNYLLDKCKDYDCVFNTNSDDWYSNNRFDKQIRYIKQGYDIVSSNFSLIEKDKVKLTHYFEKRNMKAELARDHNVMCHPVIAYSKKFVENERYDPGLIPLEDMRLWQKTIDKYKYIILADVLCYHRVHDKSVGHNLKEVI